MELISSSYDHKQIEEKLRKLWDEQKVYSWDSSKSKDETFSIDTPPPTVSGLLHMGHIFSYTQADFIARYQRMKGKTVFYPMGFDDNGLPTERLVEKVKGIRAKDVSREEFIKLCEVVISEAEEEFRNLFKSIALSVDWNHEYQTISQRSRLISQMSFLDLYYKGHIKRNYAPTFWDTIDQTAIAQAEIEDKEQQGTFNNIVFDIADGGQVIIATTRPELIPACVALLYNPEDDRYKYLQDKQAITPIFGNVVPIIADNEVDPDKGTGLVMCCTFGDIQDINWWRRYNLPIVSCINLNGTMQQAGVLNGLKVKQARVKIIELLNECNKLEKQEPVTQVVKCAERSGAVLEIISTEQWYISVLEHKNALLTKASECNWHPAYMKVRLDNWINGLNQDWCISRQRYFGVPFPVWYSKRKGEEGKPIMAALNQLPVNPLVDLPLGYTKEEVIPDYDVMDTWATSSVSPQLSSWGIDGNYMLDQERHNKLFPFDLRPQAHEIIRTWAFGTIVKSFLHQDSIPWHNLMISGWCLAEDKTKMSKSKGNVVTPRELILDKGADVVRYWASTSKLGTDITYSEETFKIGKKLLNKLWNAAKFCTLHLQNLTSYKSDTPLATLQLGKISCTLDLWILSKLYIAIKIATKKFDEFEYCDARVAIEDFFWNDFCDNYLELIKHRIYNRFDDHSGQSAILTIFYCLNGLLRLFAPFLPYITDELYMRIFQEQNSIHSINNWPIIENYFTDEKSIKQGNLVIKLLELVRKFKSNNNISIKSEIDKLEICSVEDELDETAMIDLKYAANAKHVDVFNGFDLGNDSSSKSDLLLSECNKYAIRVHLSN